MVNQKQNFKRMGMLVEFVGKAQDDKEAIQSVLRGDIQLVYISPVCILNSKKFCNMLQKSKYQEHLVVDEAHCSLIWMNYLYISVYNFACYYYTIIQRWICDYVLFRNSHNMST